VQRQSKRSLRIQKRGQRIDTKSAFFVSVHYVLRLRLSREAQIVRAVHAVAWQNHHFILNVTSPVTWSGRHSSVWGSFKFILCSWNCRTENVYYLVHLQWANEDNAMHKSDYDTNLVVFGCWDFPTTRFHDSAILLYCKE
jgi:hypothetical protein